MTDRELMQKALEALSAMLTHMGMDEDDWNKPTFNQCRKAEAALRERLAQPEQEPFGYFQLDLRLDAWVQNRDSNKGVAFYTTPQPRQWQGLTDEDVDEVERWIEFKEDGSGRIPNQKLVRYIERKLREKNT